jgi:hypothetical protein
MTVAAAPARTWGPLTRLGLAWVFMCLALAAHVTDEALRHGVYISSLVADFLGNARVIANEKRKWAGAVPVAALTVIVDVETL